LGAALICAGACPQLLVNLFLSYGACLCRRKLIESTMTVSCPLISHTSLQATGYDTNIALTGYVFPPVLVANHRLHVCKCTHLIFML
jgi:hypothetical protein